MRRVATALVVSMFVALAAMGCERGRSPQTINVAHADLPAGAGPVEGGWQSGEWLGDSWIRYPGKATLVIEHSSEPPDARSLGRMPSEVIIYLSFTPDGAGAAPSAGDMTRIVSVDQWFVSIRNDTSADFYTRLVLR